MPIDLPVCKLNCAVAWNGLTPNDKKYAHHLSRAAWAGARICPRQLSKESPTILRLILLLFSAQPIEDLREASLAHGISEQQWRFLLAYCACFLSNLGNYLSYRESKIVPGLPEEQLDVVIDLCSLAGTRKERLRALWGECRAKMYSLDSDERELGFSANGVCEYYSQGLMRAELDLVQEWMVHQGIEAWNTRVWRIDSDSSGATVEGLTQQDGSKSGGLPQFELRIASALKQPRESHVYQGRFIIHVTYGDHDEELAEVVQHLKRGLPYAGNDDQVAMLQSYVQHFETGSIEAHKESQRHWVGDISPVVEMNIGFIETYRDPMGSRAEFEGFVAIVNKKQSAKYAALVASAESLLETLPWPRDFEKDTFLQPDFTSLEVVTFASSGIPVGINIPNYDDVRQSAGFKNLSLSNVLVAMESDEKVSLIAEQDQALLRLLKAEAFEVQVGCHELLGHGSGKLFKRARDGSVNYDRHRVRHPFTGELGVGCYEAGQTWDSVFGSISSSFEECRAECVGIFFSTNPKVLEIFGHTGQKAEDVMYINWLLMIRAGLLALEFHSLETSSWRQAHMQARYAILQVLLDATEKDRTENEAREGGGFRPFVEVRGNPNYLEHRYEAELRLERSKIRTIGVPAVSNLLRRLQVYKATADVEAGTRLYEELTRVPEEYGDVRQSLLANNRPRPVFVQANTVEDKDAEGEIRLEEYEATHEGVVQSFLSRYSEWIATL